MHFQTSTVALTFVNTVEIAINKLKFQVRERIYDQILQRFINDSLVTRRTAEAAA